MRKTWVTIMAAAGVLAQPVLAQDAVAGRETFWRYCSSCHGENADGHGPMRPVLVVPPKNLTRLAAENGGVFPLERVVKRIDGRDPLISHGSEMPVYGDFFDEGGRVQLTDDSGKVIETSGVVADLVAYLRVVQEND